MALDVIVVVTMALSAGNMWRDNLSSVLFIGRGKDSKRRRFANPLADANSAHRGATVDGCGGRESRQDSYAGAVFIVSSGLIII